jgi:hypothetical protein
MSGVKKVCWNCNYCDTFAGICLKGKFEVDATSTMLIQSYTCEEFDNTLFSKMSIENDKLKEKNDKQFEALMKSINRLETENETLKELNEQLQNDIINANMNSEIMGKLSEERRVALEKCIPNEIGGYDVRLERCIFCKEYEHKPDCDYVRLIKQD